LQRNVPLKRSAVYRPFGIFRFALALLVLIQHGTRLLPIPDRSFFYSMGFGILAVATFFAISGFIVAEANATFYAGRPREFMLNRLLRLVPPFMGALVIAIVIEEYLYAIGKLAPWDYPLIGSPLQPTILLSGLLDIVPGFQTRYIAHQDFHFIPFSWSLRVEFAFYLGAFATYSVMSSHV
jgi:peptidoglycan/LPS O-acetylase OafA/YrhL